MKPKGSLGYGTVNDIGTVNLGQTHHIPSKIAEKIVTSVGASPSIKKIFQSNREIVQINSEDLHQMIVDFILEQEENTEGMSHGRYYSIEYIAKFMLESMMGSSRVSDIINHPYPLKWALTGDNSMAGDASAWQYFIRFRVKKTLISRQEFLDLARFYYSRAMKIENIGYEITKVIEQASPLVEMVIMPFKEATQTYQNLRRRSLN